MSRTAARVIIVMGVSGVGKTTVGRALAARLGADFAEGDAYHPKDNVEKMQSGRSLTDDDRWPWLDRLSTEIDRWLAEDRRVVLACSALKQSYRRRLMGTHERIDLIYLHADRAKIEQRLAARQGHYMPPTLLASQLATLEPPEDAISIDAGRPLDDILADLDRLMIAEA